jgi:hypothetical protein
MAILRDSVSDPEPTWDQFLQLLEHTLGRLGTPVRHELLDYRSRWRLLVEILLGHPPIMGGNRPRDYPFAEWHGESLALSRLVGSLRPKAGRYVPPHFHDWVVALSVIDASGAQMANRPDTTDKRHLHLIRLVLREIRNACSRFDYPSKPHPRKESRMAALLMGIGEAEMAAPADTGFAKKMLNEAEFLSAAARCGGEADGPRKQKLLDCEDDKHRLKRILMRCIPDSVDRKHHKERLRKLEEYAQAFSQRPCRLVLIKAKGVQEHIGRCRGPFFRRGASAWCSQTLALVRDELLGREPMKDAVLLSDSDAIIAFAVPSSSKTTAGAIKTQIQSILGAAVTSNTGALDRRYPLLAPWRKKALEEAQHRSRVLRQVFPDLEITVRETNLRDLAVRFERRALDGAGSSEPHSTSVVRIQNLPRFRSKSTDEGRDECFGVANEWAFAGSDRPTWRKNHGEKIGWCATAFSLAGSIYHRTVDCGITEAVNQVLHRHVRTSSDTFQDDGQLDQKHVLDLWSSRLQEYRIGNGYAPEEKLVTLLLIDGDAVGTRFIESPALCRPSIGIELEWEIRRRLQNAALAVLREKSLPFLPFDLVYSGGDDVCVELPRSLRDRFLAGFAARLGKSAERRGARLIGKIRFSYAAVDYEHETGYENGPHMRRLQLSALRTLAVVMRLAKGKASTLEQAWGDEWESTARPALELDPATEARVGSETIRGRTARLTGFVS